MIKINELIVFLSIIVFILGLFFIYYNRTKEGFQIDSFTNENCPNLLIKKDGAYFLYNKNKSEVPGVNPIRFEHLEDYTEFIGWLRNKGIKCPILYLQQTYDTQGKRTFQMFPNESNSSYSQEYNNNVKKLINAGHNKGSMPAFDPLNQYIGETTPLDLMKGNSTFQRDNPFDNNFSGAKQAQIDVNNENYNSDSVYIRETQK